MESYSIEGCTIKHETEKAVLVESENLPDDEMWVPKSQIHDDSEIWKLNDTGDLLVNMWFAEKEGLI